MNLQQRISFLSSQLSAIAPALESKQPHIRALATTALHELRVWERLNPCTDAAATSAAAELAHEDGERHAKRQQESSERLTRWKREEAPKIWRDWHRRALTHQGDDAAYLAGLLKAIPCGECKTHFAQHLAANPPQWTDPAWSYFAWTVEIHNAANKALGKPVLTILEARELY